MTGIITKNLNFQFKENQVFKNLSLTIDHGQWIGLLGANGAGKSTFLKLLVGLLNPQSGEISIQDLPPGHKSTKPILGSSFQDVDFPATIRVQEILEFVAGHYSNAIPLKDVAKDFFLEDFLNKPCGALSGGMKRRLSLALAMLGRPSIVLLDEPTTGLDKPSRARLLKNMEAHRSENKSLILMISHYPEDLVPHVNQFLVFKREQPPLWISPQRIQELTHLKVVRFQCPLAKLDFGPKNRIEQKDNNWKIVTSDSDSVIRDLSRQAKDFKNLSIEELPLTSILEDHIQ